MPDRRAMGTLVLRDGRVVEATDGFAALYGRPGAELLGRDAAELLVPADRPRLGDLRERARRGELVPEVVEVALLLPGGRRRPVEWHTDRDGDEEIVHVRDLGEDDARRRLVAALAEIGANLRAERSVESVFERLREELGRLGAVSALIRAADGRSTIVWSASSEQIQREFAALAGRPAEGFSGRMSDFARRVLAEGCAFIDDWASNAAGYLPDAPAAAARNLVERAGFSRTVAVRIDAPREAGLYLAIASPVLRSDDVPAVRLFGAQVSAALEAARTIADLSRRNAHLAVLARVAELAGAATDLPVLLRRASDLVRPVAGYLGGAIYVLDPVEGDLVRVHLDEGAPAEIEPITRRGAVDGLLGQVLRERTPTVLPFPYPGAPPGLAALPFKAIAVVPLVARSMAVGVQVVGFEGGEEAAQASLELLSSVAAHYASAVESHGLLADLRARLGELEAVHELTLRVFAHAPGDVPALLQDVCGEVVRALGAQAAAVYVTSDGGETLAPAASVGVPPALLAVPLGQAAGTIVGAAMRDRAALQTEDLTRDPRSQLAGRADLPAFAVLVVPLVSRHAVRGVVFVGDRPGRRFGPGEVAVAKALAGALGLGLENAELYADARRRAEELALLHEVGRSLVHTLDLEQVLTGGIRSLARIVDAPGAYLALLTPDGGSLELRAYAGAADADTRVGRRIPVTAPGPAIATLVYSTREPVLVEDAERDPRVSPEMRGLSGARAYLGLPLVVHDRCIGTVVIVETRGPRLFTPAEVDRAAAIANQLAVAVENARLYEDLRRSYADLARAQQQLVQGERLAALGEMSAVVAHEVRNPLGVIFNSLGSLRRLVRPTGDARMLLEIVEEEAERLNRIVGDLLDFARPSTPEVRPELLGRIADDAVTSAAQGAADRIQLVRQLDPDLPPVAMDARLVRQAILNVAVNAVQAMPRGGRLSLRTRREGSRAVVEVEDTGAGIPDEVRERIFEPFFTTKASGTGLGLAVVRRIVEGHGGEVRVRSAPGAGTTFSLAFPLAGLP